MVGGNGARRAAPPGDGPAPNRAAAGRPTPRTAAVQPRQVRPAADAWATRRTPPYKHRGKGWAVVAVPLLLVLIVLVTVDLVRGRGTAPEADSAQPPLTEVGLAEPVGALPERPPADARFDISIPSGALPGGGPYTQQGAGSWRVVPGTTDQVGQGRVRAYTYVVEVEDGVDTTAYGGDAAFATMVDQTLANPKSWTNGGDLAFRRVDASPTESGAPVEPDFRVSLTSALTVRSRCGFAIELEVSCYEPGTRRVVLNEARWVRGAVSFQGDIGSYRQYVVNHEVGHAIGNWRHVPCLGQDGLADVMMQQTISTANNDIAALDPGGVVPADGLACRFNAWPFPLG